MNGILGIFRLDSQSINEQQLQECAFQSPKWVPDHRGLYVNKNIGAVCTQRFLTPECGRGLMPYYHPQSGFVVVADLYLTNRPELITALSADKNVSDVELLLASYLKWGNDCTRYLRGPFCFAIWNPHTQSLLVAIDHLGLRPCLYAYQPGKYFIFANYMVPFRRLCPTLTVDETLFNYFALDSISETLTCYREVKKLSAGQQLIITREKVQLQRYWQLKKQSLPKYQKREDYYQAFRDLFQDTVQQYLRSSFSIAAQISGGLDSTAVAAMAAHLLARNNQSLYGFTAVPQGLEGASFRKGWFYHEMPVVQVLLQQYPNIIHTAYESSADSDILNLLKDFYPLIDQPYRNVFNFDWILASFANAAANNARQILCGQKGNGTISWPGTSLKVFLYNIYKNTKTFLKPTSLFKDYFSRHDPKFLQSKEAKNILRDRGIGTGTQYGLINIGGARQTSIRPLSLWYGVELLDPTADIKLAEFCYSLPQSVFFTSRSTLEKRLLVREGLAGILPEKVRLNANRGQQAADAYLQYNQHRSKWHEQILQITEKQADPLLWRLYDKQKMLGLFKEYAHIAQPSAEVELQICCNLIRCLSMAFFLDYLESE